MSYPKFVSIIITDNCSKQSTIQCEVTDEQHLSDLKDISKAYLSAYFGYKDCEVEIVEDMKFTQNSYGNNCKKCNQYNEYIDSKQEYICYSCNQRNI